jgi:NADPH:quinone reductase-like Zn-dependent oxidoreductase
VNPGAWAELVAVETQWLAELPEGCTFAHAATLPVAGLTAFQTLALADGLLLDKDVLITGASGGVGRFAIQLARRAGARRIVGVVGSPERGAGLDDLGATEVITDFAVSGERFDFILESAGGASLTAALNRVAPRGLIVAIGHSSGEDTTFSITDFYRGGVGASLRAFMLFDELRYTQSGARDLRTLAELIAGGDLDPQISVEASWNDPWDAIDGLMDRRVQGKAVLTVD